jgi:hypothetical protein
MPIVPPLLRTGTRDLPDVPPLVQYLIGCFLEPILAWLSTLVYRPLLRRCADPPLVLLAQWYDPAAVVAACAAYHHAPDAPGRPPTFTSEQFVRAEIVRAWAESCSDPALEELLTTNLLVRFFVGLPLTARAPDHSTLADFHAFLTQQAPDAFFHDVLTFLARVDPEEPAATPQIVDTFALASPVAASSSVAQLLRHLTLRLVRLWLAHAPPSLQHALPPLDLGALSHPGFARTALARQQHLQAALSVTNWVVEGIRPHLSSLEPSLRTAVVSYLDALAKVQADELLTDASGFVQERPPKQRGEHRIISAFEKTSHLSQARR